MAFAPASISKNLFREGMDSPCSPLSSCWRLAVQHIMKIKYRVVCGKVIKTLTRSGTVRMRRKLKKFRGLVDRGRILMDDVFASMQSWLSHTKYARSYRTKKNMVNLYNNLFDGYRLTKKFSHTKGGRQYAVLQADRRNQYRWCWDFA